MEHPKVSRLSTSKTESGSPRSTLNSIYDIHIVLIMWNYRMNLTVWWVGSFFKNSEILFIFSISFYLLLHRNHLRNFSFPLACSPSLLLLFFTLSSTFFFIPYSSLSSLLPLFPSPSLSFSLSFLFPFFPLPSLSFSLSFLFPLFPSPSLSFSLSPLLRHFLSSSHHCDHFFFPLHFS